MWKTLWILKQCWLADSDIMIADKKKRSAPWRTIFFLLDKVELYVAWSTNLHKISKILYVCVCDFKKFVNCWTAHACRSLFQREDSHWLRLQMFTNIIFAIRPKNRNTQDFVPMRNQMKLLRFSKNKIWPKYKSPILIFF